MLIFVYGTLRLGHGNYQRFLVNSRHVGQVTTAPGYVLGNPGWFPMMYREPEGTGCVVGDLFEVDERTLARLDRLEGHPTHYRRELVTLADGSKVEAYLCEQGRDYPRIASGNWEDVRKPELPPEYIARLVGK